MAEPIDGGLVTLIVIALGALAIGLTESFVRKLLQIRPRLWYLNMEIKRAEGRERKRWMKKRRELLLTLIPFYGICKRK